MWTSSGRRGGLQASGTRAPSDAGQGGYWLGGGELDKAGGWCRGAGLDGVYMTAVFQSELFTLSRNQPALADVSPQLARPLKMSNSHKTHKMKHDSYTLLFTLQMLLQLNSEHSWPFCYCLMLIFFAQL